MENLNNIINLLESNRKLFEYFSEVYIFGSVIKGKNNPQDIDLLLIYQNKNVDYLNAVRKIRVVLAKKLNYFIDLTVLSKTEEKEVRFLERLKGNYIQIK